MSAVRARTALGDAPRRPGVRGVLRGREAARLREFQSLSRLADDPVPHQLTLLARRV